MKRTEAMQIGEIIDAFVKQENLQTEMNEQLASHLWPEVVGYGINRYTISRSVQGGVMTVRLSSATLRNELMMSRSVLVDRINEAVGAKAITDIIFK